MDKYYKRIDIQQQTSRNLLIHTHLYKNHVAMNRGFVLLKKVLKTQNLLVCLDPFIIQNISLEMLNKCNIKMNITTCFNQEQIIDITSAFANNLIERVVKDQQSHSLLEIAASVVITDVIQKSFQGLDTLLSVYTTCNYRFTKNDQECVEVDLDCTLYNMI